MNIKEYTDFANKIQVAHIATAEGNQPHVRDFLMWFADETGFYFHTGKEKAVYQQLMKNPNVELCFSKIEDRDNMKMMRVMGKVEFLEDLKLKKRLLEEKPFLKKMGIDSPENPRLSVFRIAHGELHIWNKGIDTPKVKF